MARSRSRARSRPRLAIAASAAYPDLRDDWPLLRGALAERGIEATTRVWTDPEVRWSDFDLVVANGAWDNIHHPDQFLAWATGVAETTALVNSPDVLRWNLDKHYLATLAAAGVATVPTTWLATAADAPADDPDAIDIPSGEFVVKPTISGGGFETARYRPNSADVALARAHIRRLLAAGRNVMVQPYQSTVDLNGEVDLIFLGGRYSHAVAKGPLLRTGAGVQTNLFEQGEMGPVAATGVQQDAAAVALGIAEVLLGPTTYARVDLIALDDGSPAVLELELLDPALFFEFQPAAATRFAEVLDDRISQFPSG